MEPLICGTATLRWGLIFLDDALEPIVLFLDLTGVTRAVLEAGLVARRLLEGLKVLGRLSKSVATVVGEAFTLLAAANLVGVPTVAPTAIALAEAACPVEAKGVVIMNVLMDSSLHNF